MAIQDILKSISNERLLERFSKEDQHQLRDSLILVCELELYRAVKLLFDHTEISKDLEFLAGRKNEVKKLKRDIKTAEDNLKHMRKAKEILENYLIEGEIGE